MIAYINVDFSQTNDSVKKWTMINQYIFASQQFKSYVIYALCSSDFRPISTHCWFNLGVFNSSFCLNILVTSAWSQKKKKTNLAQKLPEIRLPSNFHNNFCCCCHCIDVVYASTRKMSENMCRTRNMKPLFMMLIADSMLVDNIFAVVKKHDSRRKRSKLCKCHVNLNINSNIFGINMVVKTTQTFTSHRISVKA